MVDEQRPGTYLEDRCPFCGWTVTLARSLGTKASVLITPRGMACPECGGKLLVAGEMVQGEQVIAEALPIPPGEGDTGGAGALLG